MNELLLLVGLFVGAGYLFRRLAWVRAEAALDVNVLVFNVTLPILVFSALQHAEFSWSVLALPGIAWGFLLGATMLAVLIARRLPLEPKKAGAFVIAAVFGNTTFLGYPVCQAFFGTSGLTYAVFYDLLGASIACNTVGLYLASSRGDDGVWSPWASLKKIILFPAVWALVLGLAWRGHSMPIWLDHTLERAGSVTSPLILFSIGLSLQFSKWRQDLKWVFGSSLLRLVVFPAILLVVLVGVGLPHDYLEVTTVQSAMPTMFFSLTLALMFHLDVGFAVNCIMVSTLLSLLTLPGWYGLLNLVAGISR